MAFAHIDVFGRYAPHVTSGFLFIDVWTCGKHGRGPLQRVKRGRVLLGPSASGPGGVVALSKAERRLSVAGYVVGKITGRLRGRYLPSPERTTGTWGPLSVRGHVAQLPEPFLTPNITRPDYLVDELPALLRVTSWPSSWLAPEPSTRGIHFCHVELRHLFARIVQRWPQSDDVDSEAALPGLRDW